MDEPQENVYDVTVRWTVVRYGTVHGIRAKTATEAKAIAIANWEWDPESVTDDWEAPHKESMTPVSVAKIVEENVDA